MQTEASTEINKLEASYKDVFDQRKSKASELIRSIQNDNQEGIDKSKEELKVIQDTESELRTKTKEVIKKNIPSANTQDKDYVFINFVMTYLPHGLIGLLLAVVFSAAMSSMAGELNSLASTSVIDIYKRSIKPKEKDQHYVRASKWLTVLWAVFGMVFASLANQAENLIQFVNIVGSLFYGTILGIFLSAFYIKYFKSTAVFWGAIIAEGIILYLYFFKRDDVAFLLYNIIGCVAVVVISFVIQFIQNTNRPASAS